MKFLDELSHLDGLFTFLIMELLALTSFMLANSNVVFSVLGTLLTIFAGVSFIKRFSKGEIASFSFLYLPILLISVFVSFLTFGRAYNILANITCFLGINAFFLLGVFTRRIKEINVTRILLAIYAGFALVALVSLFYTWARYGLFYVLRFKDTPIYYYNGELFNITKEQGWLFGLSFQEVTLNFTGFFGVILLTSFVPLLFLNHKENKIEFILFLVFGIIGLLLLLSSPNLEGLLYIIPIAIIALILKVLCSDKIKDKTKLTIKKVLFYVFVIGIILTLLFFVFALLNATGYNHASGYTSGSEPVSDFAKTIKGNWFLNKLFNNGRIMGPINVVLNQAGIDFNLFGFVKDEVMYPTTAKAIGTTTHMFEIEIIKEGGFFAFIFVFALIILVSQSMSRYFNKSKDSNASKATLISLILIIFLYSTFSYESFPTIHSDLYQSYFRSLPGLIFLFLIGLIYYPYLKKDEVPMFEKEVEEVKKEKTIKEDKFEDDYTFTIEEDDNHEENI